MGMQQGIKLWGQNEFSQRGRKQQPPLPSSLLFLKTLKMLNLIVKAPVQLLNSVPQNSAFLFGYLTCVHAQPLKKDFLNPRWHPKDPFTSAENQLSHGHCSLGWGLLPHHVHKLLLVQSVLKVTNFWQNTCREQLFASAFYVKFFIHFVSQNFYRRLYLSRLFSLLKLSLPLPFKGLLSCEIQVSMEILFK